MVSGVDEKTKRGWESEGEKPGRGENAQRRAGGGGATLSKGGLLLCAVLPFVLPSLPQR